MTDHTMNEQTPSTRVEELTNALRHAHSIHLQALADFNLLVETHGEATNVVEGFVANVVGPACDAEIAAEEALMQLRPASLSEAQEKAMALCTTDGADDGDIPSIIREDFARIAAEQAGDFPQK